MIQNAIFHFRVFEMGLEYYIYSDNDAGVAMAVQKEGGYAVFAGDWTGHEIPADKLPKEGFFVHGCPPAAFGRLSSLFGVEGSWPCWRYVSTHDFGSGPWDKLDKLSAEDVPKIAKYWELSDDPEPIILEKVRKYDSACVRVEGEPVSWVGIHFQTCGIAELGFAHTLEDYRRKGYSAMVTKALVNRIHASGGRAVVHMFKTNEASIGLAESMGFNRIGEAIWVEFGQRLK